MSKKEVILVALVILSLAAIKEVNTVEDRSFSYLELSNYYSINDNIIINVNSTDHRVVVSQENNSISYSNTTKINFSPEKAGEYIVEYYIDDNIIESQEFIVLDKDKIIFYTDKKEYIVGEPVKIYNYNIQKTSSFFVRSKESSYSFIGDASNPIEFIPKTASIYEIVVEDSGDNYTKNFTVKEPVIKVLLSTDKKKYTLGEQVKIDFNASMEGTYILYVISKNNIYQYLGEDYDSILFTPRESGEYTVKVEKENNVLSYHYFEVIDEQGKESLKENIRLDKESYLEGDIVNVIFSENITKAEVYFGEESYIFNEPSDKISFIANKAGEYKIEAFFKDSEQSISFFVAKKDEEYDHLFYKDQDVVINFDIKPILDAQKTILDIIFGTTPSFDKISFYVEEHSNDKRFSLSAEKLSENVFKITIPQNPEISEGVYSLAADLKVNKKKVIETKKFNWISRMTGGEGISLINETSIPRISDYVDYSFSLLEDAVIEVDFTEVINAQRDVVDQALKDTKLEQLTVSVSGHEDDINFNLSMEHIEYDRFIFTIQKNPNIISDVYNLIAVGTYNDKTYNIETLFNWGLTDASTVKDKVNLIKNNTDDKTIKKSDIISKLSIKNNKKEALEYSGLKLYKDSQEVEEVSSEDSYDLELDISSKDIKKIKFRGISLKKDEGIELGIDDVPSDIVKIKNIKNKKVLNSYAIDPTKLTFTDAIVSVDAKGSELWKCKDWNFSTESCYGEWVKIKDIVPGREYNFTLTNLDPGYAETGLATVNTNKSLYHPNEEAKIIMVVLDNEGYLVKDANVSLYVTTPDNVISLFSTEESTINETEKGIYQTIFSDTFQEGNYSLFVTAYSEEVNNSMISYFTVKEYYEFDILRKVPATTDPWQGPFTSQVKIISHNEHQNFDLKEVIPINFTVKDYGGSTLSIEGEKKILSWYNLTNNSIVSYIVSPPLVTPDLYEIGPSYVEYGTSSFFEARPWYLAIDPVVNSLPTSYTDAGVCTANDEAEAYDDDDSTSATLDIDLNQNPTYVTYDTFDISSYDSSSTLNNLNVTFTVSTTGTFDTGGNAKPDHWYLEYNTGTGWTVCQQGSSSLSKQDITCDVSFSGWTLQDFSDNFQVRAGGDKDGGQDGVELLVYEIYATLDYTPPNIKPSYRSYEKNDSSVYQDEDVLFNSTWFDTDSELDSWIFSWNMTGWTNVTSSSFTSNNQSYTTQAVTEPEGTVISWTFYANDTDGAWNNTPIQTFVVLGSDSQFPTIINEQVSPTVGVSGTVFNISATITDNSIVQDAWAEISMPNGTRFNETMNQLGSSDVYTYLYNSESGGNFSFIIWAYDGANYNYSDTRQYFNVTANISIDKTFYARGDTVQINGKGFYPESTVNIDIKDEDGASITGYPTTTEADSSGDISTSWGISSSYTFSIENYTIIAEDSTLSWLENSTEAAVVIKPSSAVRRTDNPAGGNPKTLLYDAFSEVNDSDETYANVIHSGNANEVYLEVNFSGVLPVGYNVNSAILYFEHYESSANDVYVKVYNSTSASYITLCTITNQATETFSICNVSGYATDSTSLNSLSVRFSDDDVNSDGTDWAYFDFVYLDIDFEVSTDMTVTLNEPTYDATTYDYNDANSKAYDDGDTTVAPPPSSILTGTEASSDAYTNLTASDNAYFHTLISGDTSEHAYQSFVFEVTDSISDINSITLTHEGWAREKTSVPIDGDIYYIYVWNFTGGGYELIATGSDATTDQTTTATITGNGTDFINDTTGEFWVLIEGDHITAGGTNARADLYTDYISLDINKIPVLSGLQDINATVVDGDGVAECDYYFLDSEGSMPLGLIGMENHSNNYWYNISDTNDYSDGFYTLYVNCTDFPGTSTDNASIYVKIANSAPSITLYKPEEYSNFTYSNINFTWKVVESGQGVPVCNVTVNATVEIGEVSSTSGQNTTRNTTISDGYWAWNVTCKDSSGLVNTSETRYFEIDTTKPTVTPNSPDNNHYTNLSYINLIYTPSDVHEIVNCTLYVDGQLNFTNTSITNGEQNNFSLQSLSQRTYNWSINCTDTFGLNGYSEKRNFTVDWTKPNITLIEPYNEATFSGGTVDFNFTATDNLQGYLTCNLTLNGEVSTTNNNFQAINGSVTKITETGITDGTYYWNVTCWDNAGNTNTSETRNFTMQGAPTVNLDTPENDHYTNESTINFSYYVSDGDGILNCSLYIDGEFNTTNSSTLTNPGYNNFTVQKINTGKHNWTIECYDTSETSTKASGRNFTIDQRGPDTLLWYPLHNQSFSSSTITFNFSSVDDLDPSLTCNLTLDGEVSATNNNINVVNGTNTSVTESSLDEGIHYWNVTCWDSAGNTNISETRNFTIDGPPTLNLIDPGDGDKKQENVTVTYYVYDISGIQNCTLIFDGNINQTNTSRVNSTGYNYFNLTNMNEGYHNWTVNCTDLSGFSTKPSAYSLIVDLTDPIVYAHSPNETAFSTNDIEFNFTAIDHFGSTTMTCNVSVDNGNYSTEVSASNNSYTTTTITEIQDGFHFWNITCWDEANNSGGSNELNFTIDAAPQVFLGTPADETGDKDGNVTFSFEVYDDSLANCSLIFNGKVNQTNQSYFYNDGAVNYFNATYMSEGVYNWTINCTDTNGFTGTDTERELHIDSKSPNITLNYPPDNTTLYSTSIEFNWTAYDNVDPTLTCNLSVNNTVGAGPLTSLNGQYTTSTVSGFVAGVYSWNVTCWDLTGFINYSNTWNFNISSDVKVTSVEPVHNATDGNGDITFSYIPESISGFSSSGYCELMFDGSSRETAILPTAGSVNYINTNGVTEGNYSWFINCTDNNGVYGISESRTIYVDLTNPNVTIHHPNGDYFDVSYVTFNWTPKDNLDDELDCNITIDGNVEAYDISSPNNTVSNYTIYNINDSIHHWNVTCTDNGGRSNTSQTYNFTIREPPSIILGNPENKTRIKDTNITFYFTAEDNSGVIENCTIVINEKINQTNGTITEGTEQSINASYFTHGEYNWTVNCSDVFGNIGTNTSRKAVYVDLVGPQIELNTPYEWQTFNQDDITFNFTTTDQFGLETELTCNLTLDGVVNVSNISVTSGYDNITTINDLAIGFHKWNVTCKDDLNNTNISETINFIVNAPDLSINHSDVMFNNTNPDENESIRVNATFYNIGGIPATNFYILFYDNLVLFHNVTIASLDDGDNTTVEASFNATKGLHKIFIMTNYSGVELSKLNNNISDNMSILLPLINKPENNSWSNTVSNIFNFTLFDYYSDELNYTLYLDGDFNRTDNITQNMSNSAEFNLTEGMHKVIVEAYGPRVDWYGKNSSLYRRKNTTQWYINIDFTDPEAQFETLNNTWFSDNTPEIEFNITDNMDNILNYSFYINKLWNFSNTTTNATSTHVNLSTLNDGNYNLTIEALDEAGNKKNSSYITIYIDTETPYPLILTLNNSNISDSTPEIKFNISDNLAPTINYTFYVDDSENVKGNATEGINWTHNLSSLADGYHIIKIEARDLAGNKANSSFINITIDTTAPTITIENPSENQPYGYLIDILTTITDNIVGVDDVWYTIQNKTPYYYQNGSLNSTDNWDAIWNSSNFIGEEVDYMIVNLTVYANDTLGNFRNVSRIFIIDNKRPSINFLVPKGDHFNDSFNLEIEVQNRNLTVSTYNITNSSQDLVVNNSNSSIFSPSFDWTDYINISNRTRFPEGRYNITAFAIDDVGNNRTSYNYFWIDRTAPPITLHDPINRHNTTATTIHFNFTVTDLLNEYIKCNLSIDGTVQGDEIFAENNTITTKTVNGIPEGYHLWRVRCVDNASNIKTSEYRNFSVDLTAPTIKLERPLNGSFNSSPDMTFYYTPDDALTKILNCSLIIDGKVNQTNSTVTKGTLNNFTVYGFNEGMYEWTVNCTDGAGHIGTNNTSMELYLDQTPPETNFETNNGTWFNDATPEIFFNITDNLDWILNYTIYIDGTVDVVSYVDNATSTSKELSSLHNGTYVIKISSYDDAYNKVNDTNITIIVDTAPPNITLYLPLNNTNRTYGDINFSFNVTDNLDPVLNCNLTINDVVNITDFFVNNSENTTKTIYNFNTGYYNWSLTCWDNASNVFTSDVSYFNYTPPDMEVSSVDIWFNESDFEEGKNFTIFANITNIGESEANDFKVQFFNGDPDDGGIQLNGNYTLNLTAGQNKTINISWSFSIGTSYIFVQIDRENIINEILEINNKANRSIEISAHNIVFGNITGNLILGSVSNGTVFSWEVSNATAGNIFAVDSDSSVTWTNLTAIGVNTTYGNVTNDFSEIDTALNMTNLSDSINRTYTTNSKPRSVKDYIVFRKTINTTPYVNSTNNTNFFTAILWDMSDNNPGEYNGSQDIIFVSEIKKQVLGRYGIYDFEMMVPARLRQYKVPNNDNSVTFYVELR